MMLSILRVPQMLVTVAGWGGGECHTWGDQERRLVTQDSWLLAEFQLLWVCGRVSLALPFGWPPCPHGCSC